MDYLNLFQKDTLTYEIIEDGARGLLKYNLAGPEFVFDFNGQGIQAGANYVLMYYPDPWPGKGLICLGNGTVDSNGEIHIQASADTGNLPAPFDENSEAKIWLALSDDVKCDVPSMMLSFQGQEYLFEEKGIVFSDTDFDEKDRLLPSGFPCSTNEQCETEFCYELFNGDLECASCNLETSFGCTGNKRCVRLFSYPSCEWPDISSCEQDCPSNYCFYQSPEDDLFLTCASCNPTTQAGCGENEVCEKNEDDSDTTRYDPECVPL